MIGLRGQLWGSAAAEALGGLLGEGGGRVSWWWVVVGT